VSGQNGGFNRCDIFIKKITSVLNSYSIMPKQANRVHKKDFNRTSDSLLYVLDGEALLCPGKEEFHVTTGQSPLNYRKNHKIKFM